MKKSIKVVEVEDEGLVSLMDQVITVFCMNYIYTGKLIGVNDTCILLKDPMIVYETGSFADKDWGDAQSLPHDEFYIQTSCIESFGVLK